MNTGTKVSLLGMKKTTPVHAAVEQLVPILMGLDIQILLVIEYAFKEVTEALFQSKIHNRVILINDVKNSMLDAINVLLN